MQFAKKLALIDPKILEQLQVDREYKVIQRPAPTVAKTSLSLDIGRILDDQTIIHNFISPNGSAYQQTNKQTTLTSI